MFGAIAGDIFGAPYEVLFSVRKESNDLFEVAIASENFRDAFIDFPLAAPQINLRRLASRFTDDTVMTIAVASAILHDRPYRNEIQRIGRQYPDAGYGGMFSRWLQTDNAEPYDSWGNGAAMRVSPIGWAFDSDEDVLAEARRSAEVSHNHPEAIRSAQAVALSIFLARHGADKSVIQAEVERQFRYDLHRSIDTIRPGYSFDVSSQGSVPEAIIAFLESSSVEDAIYIAISLGGDADTQAAIAGSIAEAYFGGLSSETLSFCLSLLDSNLLRETIQFTEKYLPEYYLSCIRTELQCESIEG